jgi:TPR repeat protein
MEFKMNNMIKKLMVVIFSATFICNCDMKNRGNLSKVQVEENRKLAVAGDNVAAYKLYNYYEDIGDDSEALKWLKFAAERENAEAEFDLFLKYKDTKDKSKESIEFLEKSSQHGLAKAQWYLGVLYRDGVGVDKDIEKAKKLLSRAIQNNYNNATFDLSKLLFENNSKLNDLVSAYELANLSIKNLNDKSIEYQKVNDVKSQIISIASNKYGVSQAYFLKLVNDKANTHK